MSELPAEFKTINVSLDIRGKQLEDLVAMREVSAEQIKQRNAHTEIPHFKTIMRDPYAAGGPCPQDSSSPKAPIPIAPRATQK